MLYDESTPVTPEMATAIIQKVNDEHLTAGAPRPNIPLELVNPPIGRYTLDKYLQSLYNSFAGMNWKRTEMLMQRLTYRGKWILDYYPIMWWNIAKERYKNKIKNQRGDVFDVYNEWTFHPFVFGDKTRRHPATVYKAGPRNAQTRMFHCKGGSIILPMHYVLDETQKAEADAEFGRLEASIFETLSYEVLSTWVDEAISSYAERMRGEFQASDGTIRRILATVRENMFAHQKPGGFNRVEQYAVDTMQVKYNITPDTLLTSSETMRFVNLIMPHASEYASSGSAITEFKNKISQMEGEGMGLTQMYKLRVVTSRPYRLGEEAQVTNPVQLLALFGLFYQMRDNPQFRSLPDGLKYNHELRDIGVVDIAKKEFTTLSFRNAVLRDAIFNHNDGSLDDTGRLAIMLLCNIMDPESVSHDTSSVGIDATAPVASNFLASRKRKAATGAVPDHARKWLRHWTPEAENAAQTGTGPGQRQGVRGQASRMYDAKGIHPFDGLPNMANFYTMVLSNKGLINPVLEQLRNLTPEQRQQWEDIIDSQSRVTPDRLKKSRAAPRAAVTRAINQPKVTTRHMANRSGTYYIIPKPAPTELLYMDIAGPNMVSFSQVGCGTPNDPYVKFMLILREITEELLQTNDNIPAKVDALLRKHQNAPLEVVNGNGDLNQFLKNNLGFFVMAYFKTQKYNPQDYLPLLNHLRTIVSPLVANAITNTDNSGEQANAPFGLFDDINARLFNATGANDTQYRESAYDQYKSILILTATDATEMIRYRFPGAGVMEKLEDWASFALGQLTCITGNSLTKSQAHLVGAFVRKVIQENPMPSETQTAFDALSLLDDIEAVKQIVREAEKANPAYYDPVVFKSIYPDDTSGYRDDEIRFLMQETRYSFAFRNFLLDNNLYLPQSVDLFQPDITIGSHGDVYTKTGADTAVLVFRHGEVLEQVDAGLSDIVIEVNFKARFVVVDRNNLFFVPFTSAKHYYGGGGTEFVDHTTYRLPQNQHLEPGVGHGLFVIPARLTSRISDTVISKVGDWHPAWIGETPMPLHYAMAPFARQRWGFRHMEYSMFTPQYYVVDPQGTRSAMTVRPDNDILYRASWLENQICGNGIQMTKLQDGENPLLHTITVQTARCLHGAGDIFSGSLGGDSISTAIQKLQ